MTLCSSLTVSMYMDDALTAEQAEKFRKHLKDCRTCSVVLRDYQALTRAFRRMALEEPKRLYDA